MTDEHEPMNDFAIDEKSGIPVWVQLRNRLLFLITSGRYQLGDQLPTVHKLAIILKINYNTVNKVYQSLERDGYIVSKRGRGTFVTELPEPGDGTMPNNAELITDEYLARMKELSLTANDIQELVASRLQPSLQPTKAATSEAATQAINQERDDHEAPSYL